MNKAFYRLIIEKMKVEMYLLHKEAYDAWAEKDVELHRQYCIAANDMMGAIRLVANHSGLVPF